MAAKAGSENTVPKADGTTTPADNALTSEQLGALLLTHLQQAREHNALLEKAKEALRAVNKKRKIHRNLVHTDGFPLKHFDEILEDEARARHELEDDAAKRTQMRTIAGMPVLGDTQLDLFARSAKPEPLADEDRTIAMVKLDGRNAGQRGAEKVVPDFIATEFSQIWLTAWDEGQMSLAEAQKVVKALGKRNA